MKRLLLLTLTLTGSISLQVRAKVILHQLFQDHMIIQRNAEVPIWGWADTGEHITVTLGEQSHKTQAGADGKWQITLSPVPAGGPYEMTVEGSNTISIQDIYAGEVWICSGQSNMEWTVRNAQNAENEIANAQYPLIRHFNVPRMIATTPQEKITETTSWEICSPETVGDFTAVGYYFARDLYENLNLPIGLINTSWGGTEVEAWTSARAIRTTPYFEEELETLQTINLQTFQQEQERKIREMLGKDFKVEVPLVDGVPAWAAEEIDMSEWNKMENMPSNWERRGLLGVDGVIWFRKEFILTPGQAAQTIMLNLGPIDDQDITWVNGVQVGKTEVYNEPRSYQIQANILKPGKNTITVKVTDNAGRGGLWGNEGDLFLSIGDQRVDLGGTWLYKASDIRVNTAINPNQYATMLFNGMVAPLIPYRFQGVIWYQGESNANRANQYQTLFPLMIKDWRDHWDIGEFPFLFVQLANFRQPVDTPQGSTWAELREAQTMTLSLPQTGMASTIDIGDAHDIHPRNKQDVGKRLALQAYRIAYEKDILADGPMYQSHKVEDDKIIITFNHTGEGLVNHNKYGYVPGFSIAGEDQVFHWAKAEIINANQIAVYSSEVSNPVAVRYGWADNPDDLSIYNSAGLPANPFRTDTWTGITE